MPATAPSLIIVGGGLAGGLAALAIAKHRPEVGLTLVEAGERIGGNHLWSFFDADVSPEGRSLVDKLRPRRWSAYSVRFPEHGRRIAQGYNSVESEALDSAVRSSVPADAIVRGEAVSLTPTSVELANGASLHADAVLDTRGAAGEAQGITLGWQKFVGQLLTIPDGHGVAEPVIMDATVDQADGYRFVYCLPFTPTDLFVEDTYYSKSPELERDLLAQRIAKFAADRGWLVAEVAREERGVLPVVMGGDFDRFWPAGDEVARAGVRGGFFHPLTSYSLPCAVEFALWLAREARLDSGLGQATRARAMAHWHHGRFDRLLARMLLRAADPPDRYRVLQRFYRLPEPLIARFYAGRSTLADKARILAGKPPVSVTRALGALLEQK